MHVKSERGHFVMLERSSITACPNNVLGLGSGGFGWDFFCNFFFSFFVIIR